MKRSVDPQRLYRMTLKLGFSALGLIAASVGFGVLALFARALIMSDDPRHFCIKIEPPEVPPRGEGPDTELDWTITPLPFGIVCEYGENLEIQVFTDTGTPLVVAALVCAVVALILLVVWAVLQRRLAPMWRKPADVEESTI